MTTQRIASGPTQIVTVYLVKRIEVRKDEATTKNICGFRDASLAAQIAAELNTTVDMEHNHGVLSATYVVETAHRGDIVVAEQVTPANAALIVDAVNNYARLTREHRVRRALLQSAAEHAEMRALLDRAEGFVSTENGQLAVDIRALLARTGSDK